ncbi:MAG: DUF1456 family protein [Myxococcota bacterium]
MTNNDVLRRLRYTFDFKDSKMISLFAESGLGVTREQVSDWLKREEEPSFVRCKDIELAHFLNGLIVERRGKREGDAPVAERRLNNNLILRKLKIALEYKTEDLLSVMELGGLRVSAHEMSAFFRRENHKHYRVCEDQILRNFLRGLQLRLRPD